MTSFTNIRWLVLLLTALVLSFAPNAEAFGLLPHAHEAAHALLNHQHHHQLHQLPFTNLIDAYKTSLKEHPLQTKMATGGILATAGDAIAQSRTDDPYDRRRAASFFSFDMAYRAVQHVAFPLIVHQFHGQYLSSVIAPLFHGNAAVDYAAAMEQTLASQLGIVPFLYYPVFFSLTGFVQGLTAEQAWERAQQNFVPLMQRNLLFWIPVQFIQFGFIEEQLQIPFLSVAGLCWTFILSVAAGNASASAPSQPPIAPDATQSSEVDDAEAPASFKGTAAAGASSRV